jgi:S1-C subfamily serine protease
MKRGSLIRKICFGASVATGLLTTGCFDGNPVGVDNQPKTWEDAAAVVKQSTYVIGFVVNNSIIGVATGFAINDSVIITNGHVVKGLEEILINSGDKTLKAVAVQNGSSLYGTGFYYLNSFQAHPGYDPSKVETFDIGALTVQGKMKNFIRIASIGEMKSLASGQEVASFGFPGEINGLSSFNPVGTFKDGTISATRAFDNLYATPENSFFIQYNLALSGGCSGSPVFNKNGEVVAVNNSGVETMVYNESTDQYDRVPLSSLNFGIRADQIAETFKGEKKLFSSIVPIIRYRMVNASQTRLQVVFVNSNQYDTIDQMDTLDYFEEAGKNVIRPMIIKTLVSTKNYVYWTDTLKGVNFSRTYRVSENFSLLTVKNNTNKVVNSIVVSNNQIYDSSSITIPINSHYAVGYYRASTATNLRAYFNNAQQYIYQNGINTTSENSESLKYTWTLSTTLTKSALELPVKGKKYVVNLSAFLN